MSTSNVPSGVQHLREEAAQQARMHPLQKWAWGYAALFLFVVALGYIPGLTDADGNLLGLFRIELKDDILHLASAVWAAAAAWRSARASLRYFQLFGVVYFLDAVVGLLFGQAYLDGGIFVCGITSTNPAANFPANLPHVLIGGIAVLVGFVLSRRYAQPS